MRPHHHRSNALEIRGEKIRKIPTEIGKIPMEIGRGISGDLAGNYDGVDHLCGAGSRGN
jgi:hypothetical protein